MGNRPSYLAHASNHSNNQQTKKGNKMFRVIRMVPSDYRQESYGIDFVSEVDIQMTFGQNRNYHHTIQRWDNASDKRYPHPIPEGFKYLDPKGSGTNERYSYLASPQAIVISARPLGNERKRASFALNRGDIVALVYPDDQGELFSLDAMRLDNPHLVPLNL